MSYFQFSVTLNKLGCDSSRVTHPTNMNGAVGTSQTHFRFYTNNYYVQDDWKLTKELTVNYGLRYEYVSPPLAEELDHVFGFDFNTPLAR